AALSDAAEHSLVGTLTRADGFSGQEFLTRAGGLGVDLDEELLMIAVGPPEGTEGIDPDAAATELRRALKSARWPAVVGSVDGLLTAVLTSRPNADLGRMLEDVVGGLDGGTFADPFVGVSRPCTVAQLPQAQSEARTAHRLGPSSSSGKVHFYDGLVLYRLLSPLGTGPTLANFVEDELKQLIEHDERHNGELLLTLDAYLRSNGNKIVTARALQLQRRSVYYRLERIEELLGGSVDDPELRVRLYVALRGREMLMADRSGQA
ncbi:MAG: PucR family transcriptional regulator, purine catabolism regulatory protein, partial [Solirubrobacterales bacterium]|nr:PucR family transcriptional regulator, purine catabolism regulatory protein [Solirubrobacterales bacterium]